MVKFTDVWEEGTASGFWSEDRRIEPLQQVGEFLSANCSYILEDRKCQQLLEESQISNNHFGFPKLFR